MRRLSIAVLTLLALAVPATAFAQSVPREIRHFKNITVGFSENAHRCNLTDAQVFIDHLAQRLSEMGVPQNDSSDIFVVVGISGMRFGVLGGHCATNTQLTFQTILTASNIVTNDPQVRAAVDRLGQFPVVLYESSMFGVQPQSQPSAGGPSVTSRDASLGMIDTMISEFIHARLQQ